MEFVNLLKLPSGLSAILCYFIANNWGFVKFCEIGSFIILNIYTMLIYHIKMHEQNNNISLHHNQQKCTKMSSLNAFMTDIHLLVTVKFKF